MTWDNVWIFIAAFFVTKAVIFGIKGWKAPDEKYSQVEFRISVALALGFYGLVN